MLTRSLILTLTLAAALAACTTPAPAPAPPPAQEPAPLPAPPEVIDGHKRLDATLAAPRGYDLTLRVDPRQDRFRGQIQIEIDVARPTTYLQLHGGGLDIQAASLGGQPAQVIKGQHGGLVLVAAQPLEAGPTTAQIQWEAALDEVPESLYRVQDQGQWYAYTQFEPLEAREAFPCFDDPGFKVPWRVRVETPSSMLALTNTPEVAREALEGGQWTRYTFEPTLPLPSYLIAFAVGDFDVVEAPRDAIAGVPLRVIATKGKGALASYALRRTPGILQSLTDFFGSPYPYKKLDLVAVPNFASGAMENVGLVTFRERLLLVDGEEAPPQDRRRILGVIAHELAHMWYGDLVTMAWWDDLWLNEAFATWMASRTLIEVEPSLEEEISEVRSRGWVVGLDSQEAARAIRQPIAHGGDVYNAFDGITYTKGAAVLRMLAAWMGPEAFRDGVRAYMDQHAHGTATTADLMRALEQTSRQPVSEVARAFLDQPGIPLLEVGVSCDQAQAGSVLLKQRRYLPAGSQASQGQPWHIPVCMRYAVDKQVHEECVQLQGPQASFPLQGCPTWLHPNAHERGYYLWSLPEDQLRALVKEHRGQLSLPERVALPSLLETRLRAETISADAYLEALSELGKEKHWMVAMDTLSSVGELGDVARAADLRDEYAAYVRKLVQPHLKRVGLKPRKGEPVEASILRAPLIAAMATSGQDKKTQRFVQQQALQFLKKPESVPFELGRQALWLHARQGDARYWEALKAAFDKSSEKPAMRRALLQALGNFSDPALVERSLNLFFDGTLRAQDFGAIAGPPRRDPELNQVVWRWATQNHEKLLAFLGERSARRLPDLASGFCTQEGKQQAITFFGSLEKNPAMERPLELTLERVDQCIRARQSQAEPLRAFFGSRRRR